MPRTRRAAAPFASMLLILLGGWAPVAGAAGVLEFMEPRLDLREGESRHITVVRSGSTAGAVTVVLNVALGGTATPGQDFTVELPLGVISIPDGELFGRARLNATQNTTVQGTRYAVLTLASPTGATLGRDTSLLVQIEDDETPSASLSFPGDEVRRVTAGAELPVEVRRSGLTGQAVSAVLVGVPGTAALGIDYGDLTTTLEFSGTATSRSATLSTMTRATPAHPRTLSLVLATPTPAGSAGFTGRGPVVVIEEPAGERAGEFALFTASTEVDDDAGMVVFTVDRNRGSTGAAAVSWVTVDGGGSNPALAGRDFVASTGRLEFAEGETRKTFEVALIADPDTRRNPRRFHVALTDPSALAGLDPEGRVVTLDIRAASAGPGESCKGVCDCFIATAAYGSWLDPRVATLRRFRDEVLQPHAPGRALVSAYYRLSPPLAEFIGRNEALRAATRAALAPVVVAIERPGTAGLVLLAAAGLLLNLRRRTPRKPTP